MNEIVEILFIIASYLIGSIPVGYLLVRHFTGLNILEYGSGNIGSTNVRRITTRKYATVTQLLDMAKGLVPVGLYFCLKYDSDMTYFQNISSDLSIYLVAIATIIGHDFSFFLRFKGGKGVNTTLGASILLAPIPILVGVVIYFVVKKLYKFVSLGSMALAAAMVLVQLLLYGIGATFYYLLFCMLLIIVLHIKNIQRLIHHQELPAHTESLRKTE